MRIRITDVDYVDPRDGDDLTLSYWGIAVGDEFDVEIRNKYGFVVNHCFEYLFVRNSECEVLED